MGFPPSYLWVGVLGKGPHGPPRVRSMGLSFAEVQERSLMLGRLWREQSSQAATQSLGAQWPCHKQDPHVPMGQRRAHEVVSSYGSAPPSPHTLQDTDVGGSVSPFGTSGCLFIFPPTTLGTSWLHVLSPWHPFTALCPFTDSALLTEANAVIYQSRWCLPYLRIQPGAF